MKKKIIVLGIVIVLIVLLGLFKLIEAHSVLYRSSHTNHSWGYQYSEKIIYNTGEITWYSNSNGKEEKKASHLTSEELRTLKQLAKSAKTKMVEYGDIGVDTGETNSILFRPNTHKKIELNRIAAGKEYVNVDENALKCQKMINELFRKYLNEHI